MSTLLTNIGELVTNDLDTGFAATRDAALVMEVSTDEARLR